MAARRNGAAVRAGRSSPLTNLIIIAAAILAGAFIIRTRPQADAAPPKTHQVIVPTFESLDVPVPSEPVVAGSKLRDVRWTTLAYPRHQIPPGAITDTSRYLDSVAAAPLPANLPVFEQNLSTAAQTAINPVVERIPAGMRAMTIRVDATTAVEGWAGSGSLVDVLLVGKDRTSVVAEKVKILSAERSVSPVEGSQAPSIPSTVTLLVTQEQCLAINTAIPLGRIAFALRSINDDDKWADTVYTAERLQNAKTVAGEPHTITGYVAVHGQDEKKAFALTDGRWVETTAKPAGFFAGKSEENR